MCVCVCVSVTKMLNPRIQKIWLFLLFIGTFCIQRIWSFLLFLDRDFVYGFTADTKRIIQFGWVLSPFFNIVIFWAIFPLGRTPSEKNRSPRVILLCGSNKKLKWPLTRFHNIWNKERTKNNILISSGIEGIQYGYITDYPPI